MRKNPTKRKHYYSIPAYDFHETSHTSKLTVSLDYNRNKSGGSSASFPWHQNVSCAFQKNTLVADMCFNIHVSIAKQLKYMMGVIVLHFDTICSLIEEITSKINFLAIFSKFTWKKNVILRYLLNYAYDRD